MVTATVLARAGTGSSQRRRRRASRLGLAASPAVAVVASIALLAAATAVVGCSPAPPPSREDPATGSPAASESAVPAATPPIGRIDHAVGPTDVVFRFEEGGGLLPMGFFATDAPIFTLYGDGTVIFKDGSAVPPPDPDGIGRLPVFRTAQLGEDEIQAFLGFAVAEGGLGVAGPQYTGPGADLPTSVFTIDAGGQRKTVSVTGIGMEPEPGPDSRILQALARLGEKVRNFGPEVDDETDWSPDRWRGILTPDAADPPHDWPWPGIPPADFVERPEPGAPRFPIRTMSPADIEALGFAAGGGFSGLSLEGPDGTTYLLALRPLLPDEPF